MRVETIVDVYERVLPWRLNIQCCYEREIWGCFGVKLKQNRVKRDRNTQKKRKENVEEKKAQK